MWHARLRRHRNINAHAACERKADAQIVSDTRCVDAACAVERCRQLLLQIIEIIYLCQMNSLRYMGYLDYHFVIW